MGRPGQARLAGGGRPQFRRYLAAKLDVIAQNLRHIRAKTFLLVGFQLVWMHNILKTCYLAAKPCKNMCKMYNVLWSISLNLEWFVLV